MRYDTLNKNIIQNFKTTIDNLEKQIKADTKAHDNIESKLK